MRVRWEAAYAARYTIQTSTDGTIWTTAAQETATSAGERITSFSPRTARYVRLTAVARGTVYGVSFFEMGVFGPGDGSPTPAPTSGVFVSLSGSDSAAGSVDSPFRTLQKAASVARAGDTVYVRGGTYTGATTITRTGTSAAPITFKPYPGETAVLDGTGVSMSSSSSIVNLYKSSHVVLEGFEVRNSSGRGISVFDGTNVVVRNNKVHDTWAHPIMGAGDSLTFEGNDISRGILSNENGAKKLGYWPAGLSTWLKSNGARSTNVTFRGNRVRDTWGEGINALHVNNASVVDNTVSNTYSIGIYIDNAADVSVLRNYVFHPNATFYRNGRPAAGISLSNEYYANTETRPTENITIANNILVKTSYGIGYWSDSRRTAGNTYRNVGVYSNVIKDATLNALQFEDVPSSQTQPSANVAKNNVAYKGSGGSTLSIADMAGWSFSYNAFPNGIPAGNHPASLTGDPMFVSPVTGGPREGFKLRTGSPLLRKGSAVGAVTTDMWGAPRNAPPTIGVHEL